VDDRRAVVGVTTVGLVLRGCLRSGAGAWWGGLDGAAGAADGGRAWSMRVRGL